MTHDDLNDALRRLHQLADELPPDAAAQRRQLLTLIGEIEDSVEHDGQGVVESVRHAVEEFEVSHPRATAILNDILRTLGNMGI